MSSGGLPALASIPRRLRVSGPPPILALKKVTKSYAAGGRIGPAVNEVTLDIRPGCVTALMGPSGSGKTTLLSIMGAILRPSVGRVQLCGTEISELSESERSRIRLAHVGFVFQNYNLFPALTARHNIEIVLDLKGQTGRATRRREALRLLEHMGLSDKSESYPSELSGGQKQRVAIARALAGSPSLLLADEPTAALDSSNGRRIMELFHNLAHEENRAVVIVTHDHRVLEFADRVVTIEDGSVFADELNHSTHSSALATEATRMVMP